jgi:putative endonuclease
MGIWVHILRCSDGAYYVGSSHGEVGLERRLEEHQPGAFGGYAAARRPVSLAWSSYSEDVTAGIAFERQLKGWSHAKKEAVIEGRWEALPALARRKPRS